MNLVALRIIALTEHQSTNRTNGDALTTVLTKGPTHRLIPKGGDHPPEATISKTNDSFAQFFLAYPNASAAEHTLIGIVNVQGTAGIYGELRQDFPEPFCFELHAEMLGYPLKFTRTTFWTVGTIQRQAG
jgi:hypothetical protein